MSQTYCSCDSSNIIWQSQFIQFGMIKRTYMYCKTHGYLDQFDTPVYDLKQRKLMVGWETEIWVDKVVDTEAIK